MFHACKDTLKSRSGDSDWHARRLLDEHDAALRSYVQLSNWMRRTPLRSGRAPPLPAPGFAAPLLVPSCTFVKTPRITACHGTMHVHVHVW